MFQKYKKIIIVAAVVVLLFVVYTVFFKKEEEPALSTSTGGSSTRLSAENNELISLLSQLRSIELNRDIFRNEVYLSLFDFTVILIPEPVSRPNPFAPIGSEGVIPQVQNEDTVDISAGL